MYKVEEEFESQSGGKTGDRGGPEDGRTWSRQEICA